MAKREEDDQSSHLPKVRTEKLAENMAICMVVPLGDPEDSTCMRGVTPIYWGKPGIGKSAIARSAARMAMLHIETLYPATRNPEDFSGITLPDGKGGLTTICGLAAVRRLVLKKEGVLFIDEASGAPPAVQSAMLSLILERNVGDDILPPAIRIMAAANPVDCAAGGWDFEAPTANRFLHFDVPPPTNTEWLKWYMGESTQTAAPAESMWNTVLKGWPTHYPRAKGLIAGFIKSVKGAILIHALPGEEDPQRSRAWPSPRMWDVSGRVLGTLFALGKKELMGDFIHAAVGEGASSEFMEWARKANLPEPEDMLINGWKPDRRQLDISIGALVGMTEYVIKHEDPKKYAVPAWNILNECCQVGITDLAMASAESLVQQGLAEEDVGDAIIAAAKPVIRHLTKSPVSKTLGTP